MIRLRRYAPGAWRVRGSSLLCVHTGDGWALQPTRPVDAEWLERTGMESYSAETLRDLKAGLEAMADSLPYPAYNDRRRAVKLVPTAEGYTDITGLIAARKVPYPESSQTWWEISVQTTPGEPFSVLQYAWSLDDVRTRVYEIHLMLVSIEDESVQRRVA
jgi:hypothetical protein